MTRNNLIGTIALLALLSLGTPHVFASEVTGTLSSSGVTSSNTGTSGTIGGTVSSPAQNTGGGGGGGGGGNGGGNPLTLGLTNAGGGGSTAGASFTTGSPQGEVLGVSLAQIPATGIYAEAEETASLASAQGSGNTTGQVLGATAAAGIDSGMWLWWLLILVIAAAIGYYFYQRTRHERNNGRVS